MSPPLTANWRSSSAACCSGDVPNVDDQLSLPFDLPHTKHFISENGRLRTGEGHKAWQTQAVGEDDEFHGLQTRTGGQQTRVQEFQHPAHAGSTGIRNGDLES